MNVTFLLSVMVSSSLDLTKFVRKQLIYDHLWCEIMLSCTLNIQGHPAYQQSTINL